MIRIVDVVDLGCEGGRARGCDCGMWLLRCLLRGGDGVFGVLFGGGVDGGRGALLVEVESIVVCSEWEVDC